MISNAMRQLEERHMATKVDMMVWSNKMDLLALSNAKGEITLHRLSWQKVWSLSPPLEDLTVTGIAWRPDGKVISIAYSNNLVLLVDVENKDILDKTDYGVINSGGGGTAGIHISCLCWPEEKGSLTGTNYNNAAQDSASTYLPKLPPISRTFGSMTEETNEILEDTKKVMDQTNLNFLIVGTTDGKLSIGVFGLFKVGVLSLPEEGEEVVILGAEISADLKNIFVLGLVGKVCLRLYIYDTDVLASYCREIHALAYKHGQLMSLVDYLENTVHAIVESYENMLLLEMESKLSQYTDSTEEGTVSADFLELLMFGVTSDGLATFLLQDLTDKGIKKLGNSIELSHSNIQKLILKHVQAVGQNIAYHLTELRGMARLTERFQILGVDEAAVARSFTETGSFLVKASEIQLVIDDSLKKYKALFKWLYTVMLQVSDDRVHPDLSLPEISQQETAFIAEYLYRLTEDTEEHRTIGVGEDEGEKGVGSEVCKKKNCYLDRLGQYISDRDLTTTVPLDPWEKLLKENPCLAKHPSIINRDQTASLVQQHNRLKQVIRDTFANAQEAVASRISLFQRCDLTNIVGRPEYVRTNMLHVVEESRLLIGFVTEHGSVSCSNRGFTYAEVKTTQDITTGTTLDASISSVQVVFGTTGELATVDLQFYTPETISVLLERPGDDRCAVFVQVPTRPLHEAAVGGVVAIEGAIGELPGKLPTPARLDALASTLEPGSLRPIDNMVACRLAVSGTRKVAVLLSESRHKVRTFEMEVEEDEEEDDMDTTKDTNTSNNENSFIATTPST